MAKTEAIDLTSDEPILEYIEGKRTGNGVPARDLNGGDLAHITEVELLTEAEHHAEDFERPHVTPSAAAKVAARLVETGAFRAATHHPKPVEPAAEPEA